MPRSTDHPFDATAWIGQAEELGYRVEVEPQPRDADARPALKVAAAKVTAEMAAIAGLWRALYGLSEADYHERAAQVVAELLTRGLV
ncbi:MAG: hypothetical protein KIT36_13550 [Alphaproteobacteria bacterium]|nr:hypothetical protein [Alphaproteobacteria bacterium]